MFIYLDETFNLEKGAKNQFMAVAGFSVDNSHDSARWYQKVKRKSLPKKYSAKEIKSTNAFSEIYILPEIFSNSYHIPKIKIGAAIQHKNILGQEFYYKNELNYDKLYLELAKKLLLYNWHYKDKNITIITLDTFKTKTINKIEIAHSLQTELKLKNPNHNFHVGFGTSEEKNLQFADQICGIINKYAKGNRKMFNKFSQLTEIKIIKDPFSH